MISSYDLTRIETRSGLINMLGIDGETLDCVLAFQPHQTEETIDDDEIRVLNLPPFQRHRIPKKNRNRGDRIVWEPLFLKSHYKSLGRKLDAFFRYYLDGYPHEAAFGYRSGRNIRENAQVHTGNSRLLSLDIADFFPSITTERIEKLFQEIGLNKNIACILSKFVSIDGALTLGFPTSPVISNAITLPIDHDLTKIASRYNACYSRYADDITFSGNGELPSLQQIETCLLNHGFQIASSKTRQSKKGQSHYVTGLSVSDPVQPHVPRSQKRKLRQQLYYMGKFGIDDHFQRIGINNPETIQSAINSIDGMIKFVSHHEPRMAPILKSQWNEVLRLCDRKPSFKPKQQNRQPFHISVDEAEYARNNVKILALAMSVSQHQDVILQETRQVLETELQDLWAAGDIGNIRKRGLHFADASPDLRYTYVKRLAAMPFEGYVAFHPYVEACNYQKTYLRLLGAMITRRLMAAESQSVIFCFEENSKVSRQAVESLIERSYNELKRNKNRHPTSYSVEFATKPDLRISVPDFLLGVLGKYLKSASAPPGRPEPRDRLMFDRLRDKYRLILDLSSWTEYSRRHAIKPWE